MDTHYKVPDEDLSYHRSMPSLCEELHDLSTIVRPRRALTKDLPQHLRLEPTQNFEQQTQSTSATSPSSKFGPLFSRASSVLGHSRQVSPTRKGDSTRAGSPLRDSSSPTTKEAPSSNRTSKLASSAIAFSELFQGTSELVNSWSLKPVEGNYTTLSRPSASRTTTSKSSRASIWSRMLPAKQNETVSEDEDEIMNLTMDEELFRGLSNESSADAFDTLAGNAERLFMKVQIAHSGTLNRLISATTQVCTLEEELAEEKLRTMHLKAQLDGIGSKVSGQEKLCRHLQEELNFERQIRVEQQMRESTIRQVPMQPTLTLPGKDGHRLFSGERGDSMFSLTQAGLDLSDEDSAGESPMWSPPLTPAESRASSPSGSRLPTLAEENRALRARILELEETVEGCLGLVANLSV